MSKKSDFNRNNIVNFNTTNNFNIMSKVPIIFEYDYKFRAECSYDVDQFVELFGDQIINIERHSDPEFPDVDVEFSSLKDINEVRKIMEKIEDGHVMLESLNYAHDYTGERYYEED